MRYILTIATCLAVSTATIGAEPKTFRTDHALVTYAGIDERHAEAIARTVEAARAAAGDFGFNMPETVEVTVTADRAGRVRLFTDGQDHYFLSIRTQQDLRKPSQTGIFHLYGLCHETGHLAMYRAIRDHGWMTPAAAEGWAHYIGSRFVDAVHARQGKKLWPDSYDYLADGTQRLNAQLAGKKPSPVVKGAALWKELAAIVGDKGVAPIFAAWGKAKIDPFDPGGALRKALLATNADKRLAEWWNKAEPLLVFKRPRSGFAARTAKPAELSGRPVEHAHDDGGQAGKKSIAGGGHAVKFQAPGDGWYLTAVRIHGSRYGYPRPPRESIRLWLCDKDFKVIAELAFPYSSFTRGPSKWVRLRLPTPTNVPPGFIVCVGFNPTATKGVFVSHDKAASGNSLTGLPGRGSRDFTRGDWMIRASLDQLRIADALKPPK